MESRETPVGGARRAERMYSNQCAVGTREARDRGTVLPGEVGRVPRFPQPSVLPPYVLVFHNEYRPSLPRPIRFPPARCTTPGAGNRGAGVQGRRRSPLMCGYPSTAMDKRVRILHALRAAGLRLVVWANFRTKRTVEQRRLSLRCARRVDHRAYARPAAWRGRAGDERSAERAGDEIEVGLAHLSVKALCARRRHHRPDLLPRHPPRAGELALVHLDLVAALAHELDHHVQIAHAEPETVRVAQRDDAAAVGQRGGDPRLLAHLARDRVGKVLTRIGEPARPAVSSCPASSPSERRAPAPSAHGPRS
mmetsp:Transcript_26420/g.85950  ORF Transcript_26420/g.85950 Transcript_26420/m.85950 type:complete len:308 (+) Transcript_26420:85-1008(+)